MNVSKANQVKVFEIMVYLINKKGAKNKLVSVFDIHDILKAQGINNVSKIHIEMILDVLIQHKYVRYFKNEKGYIYFGITQLGWEKWDARTEGIQQEVAVDEHVKKFGEHVEEMKAEGYIISDVQIPDDVQAILDIAWKQPNLV